MNTAHNKHGKYCMKFIKYEQQHLFKTKKHTQSRLNDSICK